MTIQRRLKATEKQIKRISEEFEHNYADSPEMLYMDEEIRWEGNSRLIFIMAQRNVCFKWNGMRDYGFIRLCRGWMAENDAAVMTPEATLRMIKAILPDKMYSELSEELAALELS